MITNFEQITHELSGAELQLLPGIIASFKRRTKNNPIKAPAIVEAINKQLQIQGHGVKFTETRLRKVVNYIRSAGIIPLIATSKGYYVSYDHDEIRRQVKSMYERANAILSAADSMNKWIG